MYIANVHLKITMDIIFIVHRNVRSNDEHMKIAIYIVANIHHDV